MIEPIYFINVGSNGTFKPSKELKTTPKEVDELIDYVSENDIKKIALHFYLLSH